jgi:photosystem II stability/assembly factor-like uncharacterized protein
MDLRLRRRFQRPAHMAVFALAFQSALALAGVNRWTSGGPPGPVIVLVSDPTNLTVLYAGTAGGGIFKSLDKGSTWSAANGGLSSLAIYALAVDPRTPSIIYAGLSGGDLVAKSLDGGESWRPANTGLTGSECFALAIDPANPSTLYASMYWGQGDGGVYKSTNAGDSWTLTGLQTLENSMAVLAIDPKNPATVYAGGAVSNVGIAKTTDGGATWTDINNGIPGRGIAAIAIDPVTPATVYAVTWAPRGVFKSTNGGGNWSPIDAGLPSGGSDYSDITCFVLDPKAPSVFYVGYLLEGVYESTNGGGSWSAANGGLGGAFVWRLFIDSGAPSTLYAATGQGVFKRTGEGANWSPINRGLAASQIQSLAIDPGQPATVYAGTYWGGGGLFKSTDAGATWGAANSGLSAESINAIAVDPRATSTLYAGDESGNLFKSVNGGAAWSALNADFGEHGVLAIAVDPNATSNLYVGTYGGLFKTTDGGTSWSAVPDVQSAPVWVVAIDPTNSSTIYAGSLFKSTDGGATWTSISDGLQNAYVHSLAISPSNPSILYAGGGAGLFKSEDAGGHWTSVGEGLGQLVTGLAIDPGRPTTVYAASRTDYSRDFGVFRTADGGATWSPFNNGRPYLDIPLLGRWDATQSGGSIVIDPTGTTLYIGTNGSGVFDFQLSEASEPCVASQSSLCLNESRFRVRADWRAPSQGTSGHGTAVSLSGDTGYFWFFNPDNVEMLVKVLAGCGINGHEWVFAGGLTDVEVTLTVTDTQTGEIKAYVNPAGTPFQPIQDTAAFASCPASLAASFAATYGIPGNAASSASARIVSRTQASPCTADPTTLCLSGARFQVQAGWRSPSQGTSGQGAAVSLTSDTGTFWFFSAGNVEVIVKVLDACSLNSHEWVFAAGLTDVEVTLTVTDTLTGAVQTYVNAAGTAFQPIQDTAAFATCP